jgi:phosphoglycerate dehydrogenase-like enzyme
MKVLTYIAWPVKAWRIPERHVQLLRERFPEIEFVHVVTEHDALHAIVDVDVSFSAFLSPQMVGRARRLQWVHSSAAAVDGLLPVDDLARRKIVVTNSRGIQAVPMAEQVMGGLLVLARRLNATLAAQREHRWIQDELCEAEEWPSMLYRRAMTIVGLGTTGQEIAHRAQAFGMSVTGVRRRPDQPRPASVQRVVGPDRLADALRGCDVLVITAPSGPATNRLIGAEQLALLNPGAIVVNVARASIVDHDAMAGALGDGRLGGAVLDVFEREPLDPSSPLWSLPNVVITPHSAGFRATHWDDVTDLFCDNLRRYLRGEPLLNVVDLELGY